MLKLVIFAFQIFSDGYDFPSEIKKCKKKYIFLLPQVVI